MHRLSIAPAVTPYSELDRKLFAAIPQTGEKINLKQLIYIRLKHDPTWNVKHPRNILSTYMIRLQRKIERNEEPFALRREGIRREQVWYSIEAVTRKATRRPTHSGAIRRALLS